MKKKVLVVDDDTSVRESLAKVLREEDYEVIVAADGQEALVRFEEGRIDLLLLDLGLPVKSGWDTFERISGENPLVPVIIMTGQANQYRMAVSAGVGALMEKPLDVPRLLKRSAEPLKNRIRRLCGRTQDARQIARASELLAEQRRE